MFHTPNRYVRAGMLGALATFALSGCNDMYDTKLDNGMRVIVKEDHRSPVVVSMVWYKVGSIDEPKGLTGISHALEHMMFKGTKNHGPNEMSRIIAENGGRENAFTSSDYTAYFQQLEKSRLPIAFELEADRMQNLTLDAGEFSKEIQVVMEERRLRTDDQPDSLTYEKMLSTAYQVSPYHHPVIGWMEDLKKLTIEDLRAWYQRYYRPNNATLVVVGDVNPSEVVDLAKKYFGPIPARPFERPSIPTEPKQTEARQVEVRVPAQVPYMLMGYHVPVFDGSDATQDESDRYALMVLAGILDGGQSARLERELVRKEKVAARVGAGYDPIGRASTLFIFDGTPASGHDVKDLERALRAQIERFKREPVAPDELARVKAQVVAGDVYRRDSVFYQAMQLGQLAVSGLDLDLLDERVRNVSAVTPEQVAVAARKYLVDSNLTVATLDPLPMAPGANTHRAPPAGGSHDAR
jgi:zinc protease